MFLAQVVMEGRVLPLPYLELPHITLVAVVVADIHTDLEQGVLVALAVVVTVQ
jgi:hypothetical protein